MLEVIVRAVLLGATSAFVGFWFCAGAIVATIVAQQLEDRYDRWRTDHRG